MPKTKSLSDSEEFLLAFGLLVGLVLGALFLLWSPWALASGGGYLIFNFIRSIWRMK